MRIEFERAASIRGKVSVSFTITPNPELENNKLINETEFGKTIEILNKIKKEINSEENITLDQMLMIKDQFLMHSENGN